MNKVRIYPQLELLNTWAIDRTRFNPDATEPPLCLRCGRPLHPVLSRNGHSRYIDVRICDDCDMDETWGAAMGRTKYFINWDAVTEHRLKVPADDEAWIIKSICPFDQIYLETSKDELGHKSPRTEVAYSRSDYDGQRWWTTWFTAREELKTQERIKEIDLFMESLFALPEMASLETMHKMCRVYAAPTSERTEFNLFCDTDHFHVWLRLITRERDYNLYVHFYVDESKR